MIKYILGVGYEWGGLEWPFYAFKLSLNFEPE